MNFGPRIIYIDDEIIIIDKPAGMPSASLKKDEKGTLASWVLEKFPEQKKIPKGELEAGLIHRLDNDTSGLIVATRNTCSYTTLRNRLEEGHFKKGYIAIVLGRTPGQGTVTLPIAHHPEKKKKMVVCRTQSKAKKHKGRKAITHFKTIKFFASAYSLLGVKTETGVRHQIRIHMAALGFPLAGDSLYQTQIQRRQDILAKAGRHFLHANFLEFRHPTTNKLICFESKLPADFTQAIRLTGKTAKRIRLL